MPHGPGKHLESHSNSSERDSSHRASLSSNEQHNLFTLQYSSSGSNNQEQGNLARASHDGSTMRGNSNSTDIRHGDLFNPPENQRHDNSPNATRRTDQSVSQGLGLVLEQPIDPMDVEVHPPWEIGANDEDSIGEEMEESLLEEEAEIAKELEGSFINPITGQVTTVTAAESYETRMNYPTRGYNMEIIKLNPEGGEAITVTDSYGNTTSREAVPQGYIPQVTERLTDSQTGEQVVINIKTDFDHSDQTLFEDETITSSEGNKGKILTISDPEGNIFEAKASTVPTIGITTTETLTQSDGTVAEIISQPGRPQFNAVRTSDGDTIVRQTGQVYNPNANRLEVIQDVVSTKTGNQGESIKMKVVTNETTGAKAYTKMEIRRDKSRTVSHLVNNPETGLKSYANMEIRRDGSQTVSERMSNSKTGAKFLTKTEIHTDKSQTVVEMDIDPASDAKTYIKAEIRPDESQTVEERVVSMNGLTTYADMKYEVPAPNPYTRQITRPSATQTTESQIADSNPE